MCYLRTRFFLGLWLALGLTLLPVLAQESKTLAVVAAAGPLAGKQLYRTSHALLIGVGDYQHLPRNRWLKYAAKDAAALKAVLTESYGFPPENVTLLQNAHATRKNIEQALASLANRRKVDREDRVLLFFSGHGQTVKVGLEGEMGFLIPYDARVDLAELDNPEPYLNTCLDMENVWKYLRTSPAKHTLLLADACFSGLLAHSKSLEPLNPNELAKRAEKPARQVITAGGKGEEALEYPALGHGAFTYKLLDELQSQARNGRGEVFTATDLYAVLKRSVPNVTDGKQSPQFGNYQTEGDFLFAPPRVRGTVPQRAAELVREAEQQFLRVYAPEQTIALARGAILTAPDHAPAHALLGHALLRRRDLAGAEKALKESLRLEFGLALAHAGQAALLLKKRDLPGAESESQLALRLDPNSPVVHYVRGQILIVRGRDREAEQAFRRATEVAPEYAAAHYELGSAFGTDRWRQAEAAYRKAMELDPRFARPYSGLGMVALLRGQFGKDELSEAEKQFRKAIELERDWSEPHLGLALTSFLRTKKRGEFEQAIQKAVKLDPKDAVSYACAGFFYLLLEEFPEAERAFRKAAELHPAPGPYLAAAGLALVGQKKHVEAERTVRRAIELDPTQSVSYNALGVVLEAREQLAAAETAYRKAIELDESNETAHDHLGQLLLEREQVDEAIRHFERAVELDPEDDDFKSRLTAARFKKGLK